jgi:hypothetical protein
MLRFALLSLVTVSILVSQSATASEHHGYAVGSCNPRLTSFATISAAVSSVPPGSTILVCPGTYPEQVTISQPLTLQGIQSANQDDAILTVPITGLAANTTSLFGEGVAAQILVQTPGPVNIVNISVDGTGSDTGCSGGTWVAGVFYTPGSSGTVSRDRVSGQMNSGCGAGIWAEGDGIANQHLDIGDSSVHDVGNVGIFLAENATTPTLVSRVHDNTVSASNALFGIAVADIAGMVSENDVSDALFGIVDQGPQVQVSSNFVRQSSAGIVLQGGGQVRSNQVSNSAVGVLFFADGGNVQSNRITNSNQAAIEFSCFAGSARNNIISDALVGFDQEPAMFAGFNSFDNTGTVSTDNCAVPLLAAAVQGAAAKPAHSSDSVWQWRSPASPAGAVQ